MFFSGARKPGADPAAASDSETEPSDTQPVAPRTGLAAFFGAARQQQAAARSTLSCGPLAVPLVSSLKLLGVHFDKRMLFGTHAEELITVCQRDLLLLKVLARYVPLPGLRTIYMGRTLSKLLYSAEIWWPLLTDTRRQELSSLHMQAARIISGTLLTAPTAACLAEAGLRQLDHLVRVQGIRSACKLVRFCDYPVLSALTAPADLTSYSSSYTTTFGSTVRSIAAHPLPGPREPLLLEPPFPPYSTEHATNITFDVSVGDVKKSSPISAKLAFNQAKIASSPAADAEIWPDGSVKHVASSPFVSSAGAFILFRPGEDAIKGGGSASALACSYTAEAIAVVKGLEALLALPPEGRPRQCNFYTDSLSLLLALSRGPLRQRSHKVAGIWEMLLRAAATTKIHLAFVFAHCDLARNDEVDLLAKELADGPPLPSPPIWVVDEARYHINQARFNHDSHWIADMGAFRSTHGPRYRMATLAPETILMAPSKFKGKWMFRSNYRTLAQLRTGVCPKLGGWRHEVQEPCPRCLQEGVLARGGRAVEHLFACTHPEMVAARLRLEIPSPSCLWEKPSKCLEYFRAFVPPRAAEERAEI
jgi:ribonuclease HI